MSIQVIALSFDSFSPTDVILILGVLGVVISRLGEGRGWFRNAAGLRTENTDLLRRNTELQDTIGRHEETIGTQGEKIIRLEGQVRTLEQLDQSAVLNVLRELGSAAVDRGEYMNRALDKIVALLQNP